jgi:pentatricopeptide repeat protein
MKCPKKHMPQMLSHTLHLLMFSVRKEGQWQEATKVLHEMLDKGYNPNDITYNALIDGLCREGKLEEALWLLDVLVQIGHQPNEITQIHL